MKKYQISRLKNIATFGEYEEKENEFTGITQEIFKGLFTKRFGYVSTNMALQYAVTGGKEVDTLTIAIRHDARVTDKIVVRIDGTEYDVVARSIDDDINAYDVLTLKKTVGH